MLQVRATAVARGARGAACVWLEAKREIFASKEGRRFRGGEGGGAECERWTAGGASQGLWWPGGQRTAPKGYVKPTRRGLASNVEG